MIGLTFSGLTSANARRRREWHRENSEPWSLVDWSNELAGEVGEACNVVKKIRRIETNVGRRGPRTRDELVEHLMQELADVVICADLVALELGCNLGKAVRDKFNATSLKHGLETRL